VTYVLLGADGRPYESEVKGQWGGHRGQRIYGRLDCPSALRAIARGGYVRHRVFFADEATAVAAGYRPCAICCAARYQAWKSTPPNDMNATWVWLLQSELHAARPRPSRRGPGLSL